MYMQNRNRLIDIENKLVVIKGRRVKLSVWDQQTQTSMYKVDKQQGYIV